MKRRDLAMYSQLTSASEEEEVGSLFKDVGGVVKKLEFRPR